MRKVCLGLLVAGAFAAGYAMSERPAATEAGDKKAAGSPKVGHMVYFTLKDNSPAAKRKLVQACKKYLTKHEGEVYFAAGVLAESLKREVNDTDWDVALHLVFRDMTCIRRRSGTTSSSPRTRTTGRRCASSIR